MPPSIRATINRAYRANEPGIVTLSSVAQKKSALEGEMSPLMLRDSLSLSLPLRELFLSIIDAARRRHSRSKVVDRVLDATVTRRPPSSIARKGGRKANVREFHSRQETIIFLRQRGERRRIRFRIRKLFVIVEETQRHPKCETLEDEEIRQSESRFHRANEGIESPIVSLSVANEWPPLL